LIIGGIALLHTPPMQRLALHKLQQTLAAQGIRLEASALNFNLLSLRARMDGVVIQPEPSMQPLARAEGMELQLSLWQLIRGHFVITNAKLNRPEIWLVIDAAGLTNLPKSKTTGTEEPLDLLVKQLQIANASVTVDDVRDGLRVVLPRWDAVVTGEGLTNRQRVELKTAEPGQVNLSGKTYSVDSLQAIVNAGKDDVAVEKLALAVPGGTLSGSVALRDFDRLHLSGGLLLDADVARFVAEAAGRVHVEVRLAGEAKQPMVSARLRAEDAAYQTYKNIDVQGDLAFDGMRQTVAGTNLAMTSPFGSLSGSGTISLSKDGASSFNGTIQGVDISRFEQSLASRASGRVNAGWKGLDVQTATGDATIRLEGARRPAPGIYPISGNLRAFQSKGGTALRFDALQLSGISAQGTIEVASSKAIQGEITARSQNIAAQPYAELPIAGPFQLNATVSGTVGSPLAAFQIHAPGLTASTISGIEFTAKGTAGLESVDLDQALLTWAGQSITASGFVRQAENKETAISLSAQAVNTQIHDVLIGLGKAETPVRGIANLRANIHGTINRPEGRVDLAVSGLEAYGERLGELTAIATADKEQATIREAVLAKAPNERAQLAGTYNINTRQITANLRSDEMRFSHGSVAVTATAAGTMDQPSVSANLQGRHPEAGPLDVTATLEGERLAVKAAASQLNLRADITGSTKAPYPFEADAELRETDLAKLPPSLIKDLQGALSAKARATGELANPKGIQGAVDADKVVLIANGQTIQTRGPMAASYANGTLSLRQTTIEGGGASLTASGTFPGTLSIDGKVNVEAAHRAFTTGDPAGREKAAGEIAVTGSVQSEARGDRYTLEPNIRMSLTGGYFTSASISPLSGGSFNATLANGDFRIEALQAQWANATISGSGRLPLGLLPASLPVDFAREGGPAQAELTVMDLHLSNIAKTRSEFGGKASFTARVQSARPDVAAMEGELRFSELSVQAGKVNLNQEAPSVLRLKSGTVNVEQFALAGPSSNVRLSGTAGLTGEQELKVDLDSKIDLGLLSAFSNTVRAQGPATAVIALGGTVTAPQLTGTLAVSKGDVSVQSPRIQAEGIDLRVDLAKDQIRIPRLEGQLNGGTLKGSGSLSLKGMELDQVGLRVAANGVYLDVPANLKTLSNVNLTLQSSGTRYLLGGSASIVEGSYTEPLNLDQGLLNVLNSRQAPELEEDRSPLLERLDYNVKVKTEHPLVVDNNLAKAEVNIDARLTGRYYSPGLVGRVTIEEGGSLNLNERNYLVDRGILTFTDENKIEPSFDVVAKTQASGYDVTLSLQGSGKERETILTSDPPLPEPDIAAVLLTGRTMEELKGQELDVAKEQVLSYLTGRVGGSLGRGIEQATGLSQVRIEPNLIANESDPSARLTVGQNFTRQLSLVYSMNLTDSGDQILMGQYDVSKRFRTRTLKQSDNTYRFDFSRKQEFGGAKPEPTTTAERERKKIGDVRFTGSEVFSQDQLTKWLDARRGKTYDFFKIRKGVERISRRHAREGYLESKVRLERTDANKQVDLDVNVEVGPKVDFVYEGFRPSAGLRRKIRQQWQMGVFDLQRAEDASAQIREELIKDGHLRPVIEHTIEQPELTRKRVVFDVQPGDKFNKPELIFAGAKGVEESELRDLLRQQDLTMAALTRPVAAMDLLTRYYREQGFLDAKVAQPEIVLDAPTKKAQFIYPVAEGPKYRVGDIRFSGNTVYNASQLLSAVTLASGEDYRPDLREESLTGLHELYARRGYNDAELTYVLDRRSSSGLVDIDFRVAEGAQSVLQSVTVEGNDATSERLIRSQLEVKAGDPLDPSNLNRSRRNLYSTGAYSLIDVQRTYLDTVGGKKPVDLAVHVRELRPFLVNYGAYFDTERGPGGIVDLSNRNSLGSARVLGFRARYDADLQEGRLYFTQPILKRFPLRTTASTFVRREVRDGFNTDRTGVSVLQEARFKELWVLNYGYRLEKTRTYDRGPDPFFDVTLRVAPFTTSLTRDTRDDLLDATRGTLLSHAIEYAPTFSGSELNFVKYFGQYFRYFAFDKPKELPMQKGIRKSRLVFATGVRVGLATGLNGQELIPGKSPTNRVNPGDRFFAGGGTTIRGFAQDGVGPRMFDGVSPTGGDALFILNNEMRFPLLSIFDGVGFLDVGNVYDRLSDFRPWSVRKAAGLGIRIRTPYFLIRFDYGIKLDRKPGESWGRPFISIGQAF